MSYRPVLHVDYCTRKLSSQGNFIYIRMQIDATPTVFATESTSAARADAALRSPFSFSSAAMRSSIVESGFTYAKKPPVRMV